MKKQEEKTFTQVMFRKFENGEIIALFPSMIVNSYNECGSYMHFGQHSPADYDAVIEMTTQATKEEYTPLYKELLSVGYDNLIILEEDERNNMSAEGKEFVRHELYHLLYNLVIDWFDREDIIDACIDDVIKDIEETADIDFTEEDVRIAFVRVMKQRFNAE